MSSGTDAAELLARLRAEGRRVYLDESDRTALRVSGGMTPESKAELVAVKPQLLELLEAENLAEEIARQGSPFAGPEAAVSAMLVRYRVGKVPTWVSPTGWMAFPCEPPGTGG